MSECSSRNGCSYSVEEHTYTCLVHGTIHKCDSSCTLRFVNNDSTITCKISGKCFDQMIQEHPFQRVTKNVGLVHLPSVQNKNKLNKKRKRERDPFHSKKKTQLRETVRTVVIALLYSTIRQRMNEKKKKKLQQDIRRQVKRYKRKCMHDKSKVKKDHVDIIIRGCIDNGSHRMIPVIEQNDAQMNYYITFILRLWYIIGTTPYAQENKTHMHIKDHILGTLYLLQHGLTYGKKTIIEPDTFLLSTLPPIQDLNQYGCNKRSLTIGKNHIYKALRSCNEDQVIGHIATLPPKLNEIDSE